MDKINTSVFTRLKRLFSTDVIIRNQGDNQLRTVDINKIQNSGRYETNALVDRFSRLYNSTSLYASQTNINYQILRPQLYSDYDVMDNEAIIASVLDIIADECTLKNDMKEVLQIKSSNEDIQKTLYNLFYDVLNIEFNLWSWIRQMCKYGDFFLKLEISEKFGIYNVIPFTAYHVERLENYDPKNPTAVKFRWSPEGIIGRGTLYGAESINSDHKLIENYEMAHFRLLTDVNYLPYGRSFIEPARRVYKQYSLIKDAMLIHRIVRAPDKRIFKLNIGNINANEVDAFMQKTINKMKKIPFMDPQTGEYNLRFNLMNMTEDYYIPVRGNDNATEISTAPGLQYDGIQDVVFLRDELFAALKVPKAFLGYEKDLAGKSTLASQDIRFARTIDRIQRIVLSELYKIALVHLYTQGYNDADLVNFELDLTTSSIIYEQERLAVLKEKGEIIKLYIDSNILPSDWCYEHILDLSQEQYHEMRELIISDKKRNFRLTQIEEEGNDPLESGKSFGTPHDLAALYGKGRYGDNSLPEGYNENVLGRPVTITNKRNTQNDNFGKDRLGVQGQKVEPIKEVKKLYLQHQSILENMKSRNFKNTILDESQLSK